MDTEEGVEVVWNEVLFSEKKISESQHVNTRDFQEKYTFTDELVSF